MRRFVFILLGSLFMVSCSGSGSSPTLPGGGSFSLTGPLLEAMISYSNIAQFLVTTPTGPVTNAAVTLSFSGGSVPLAYTYSSSGPVTYSGGVTYLNLAYYSATSGWTYTANQPYTMTASFGGNTYSSSITAVGNETFQTGSSGVTCSWTGGVSNASTNPINATTASALETSTPYTSYIYPPGGNPPFLTSPFTIAASSLSGHTTGNYMIMVTAVNIKTSAFPGAYGGSFFSATDQQSTTY
jgi:hypothetical protein